MADLTNVEDRTYWSHLGSIGIQAVRAEVLFYSFLPKGLTNVYFGKLSILPKLDKCQSRCYEKTLTIVLRRKVRAGYQMLF